MFKTGLAEIRAVTPQHVYRMTNNRSHLPDPYFFGDIVGDIRDLEASQRRAYVPMMNDGTMTIQEVNERFWHETWLSLAGRLKERGVTGFTYTREKRHAGT